MNSKELLSYISLYDKYTYQHVYRVAQYTNMIGKQLHLSNYEMNLLLYSSLLHDIGKIFLPIELLQKKEMLTIDEFNLIKEHVILSLAILPDSMKEIKDIIMCHHERLDGSGYPNKLTEEHIPELAKIIAVADSYDAMTSNRLYNKIKTKNEAIKELFSNTIYYGENKYSYTYVKAFNECIKK